LIAQRKPDTSRAIATTAMFDTSLSWQHCSAPCLACFSGSVDGPDVTFAGALEIRDPEMFAEFVARGVVRRRAF
jgi:hypothetical protein